MPKNNRNGQAAILSDGEYFKIRSQIKNKKYQLLLDLAWFTGERWGALVQLKFEDIYQPDGKPLEIITFRAVTRKASPDGKRKTRQVPTHPTLKEILRQYKTVSSSGYLFPAQNPEAHINLRLADKILRTATERAGLGDKGISTHSTRRSFITKLHSKGVDLYTLQKITGHQDLKALNGYVEIEASRITNAIALI
ncbi:MAG: tyrosine-type recombinase/integrase [Calothrix sp. FI2-JRJ7]|jgi:integrase/recombinase XerD|nr:tyrosine-type recombinase/integrase [Calothrix sp. FI2-JRJ7]MBW4598749.1 tyrosine-type recombinase/integrase [Calothrix sp. FI2-JRJ7]